MSIEALLITILNIGLIYSFCTKSLRFVKEGIVILSFRLVFGYLNPTDEAQGKNWVARCAIKTTLQTVLLVLTVILAS